VYARAISRFYIAAPLSSVFMGVLAGPLLNLQGTFGLAGWQWLFLVEGIPPILLSVVYLFLLPNNPAEAKWLTDQERTWLVDEVRADAKVDSRQDKTGGALRDPRVWLLSLVLLCMLICSYGYSLSAPAILKQATGLSVTKVGLLVAAMGLLQAMMLVAGGIHSDRTRERYLHVAIPLLTTAVAYVAAGLLSAPAWVVLALTVSALSSSFLQAAFWAIPPSFLKGARSAAAGTAAVSTLGILGGFFGPYWMGIMKDLTGKYQAGLITLAVPGLIGAAIILVMRRSAQHTSAAKGRKP
jgi:ACS family tartrate transporter-like MFS transporter